MNRSTRTFVVVAIAVAVASLATFGVFRAVKNMPVREVEVRSHYQVVAAQNLDMGKLLTKEDVKLVPWPASSPVENGFTTIESVLNRGLTGSVLANEPLTEGKVAPLAAGAGLQPSITEGMRALSVKVNEVIGVAGFVVPGSNVDVLVTLKGGQNNEATMTRVVVSNIKVLTAGTRYDQEKARDGQPIPTSVVTLLVTPGDAERIALAAQEGSIMLTLRNPMDRAPTVTDGVRASALMGAAAPPPVIKTSPQGRRVVVQAALPVVAPPPVPKAYTVETIRGAKRAEEVVR